MKNIALITAKGSNQTLHNKNLIQVLDKSFLAWVIETAKKCPSIDEVFVSTESPLIITEAELYGAKIIKRPESLAKADTNHGDVILHGVKEAKKILNEDIDTVTVLLGNTISVRPEDIENAIELLKKDNVATSCMTIWKAQDDHPLRAMIINKQGYLESYSKQEFIDTNRQSYPDVYFYDQGPWVVRYATLENIEDKRNGPASWWWMGDKSLPIIRNWVTGRDIHTQLDVEISRLWLKENLWKY